MKKLDNGCMEFQPEPDLDRSSCHERSLIVCFCALNLGFLEPRGELNCG